MDDYELATLERIRAQSDRLAILTDQRLSDLYRRWSQETYNDGWFIFNDASMADFVAWATCAPCDDYAIVVNEFPAPSMRWLSRVRMARTAILQYRVLRNGVWEWVDVPTVED